MDDKQTLIEKLQGIAKDLGITTLARQGAQTPLVRYSRIHGPKNPAPTAHT